MGGRLSDGRPVMSILTDWDVELARSAEAVPGAVKAQGEAVEFARLAVLRGRAALGLAIASSVQRAWRWRPCTWIDLRSDRLRQVPLSLLACLDAAPLSLDAGSSKRTQTRRCGRLRGSVGNRLTPRCSPIARHSVGVAWQMLPRRLAMNRCNCPDAGIADARTRRSPEL